MKLKEKLELWSKITGVNPQEKKSSYTIKFSDYLSDYQIEQMNNRIIDALSYDETGTFAEAYLMHYFHKYLEERKFTCIQLVSDPKIEDYISDVKRLHAALKESNAEDIIMNEAHKAMAFYELEDDKLSLFDVIELRTSAMKCIDSLETVQFMTGSAAEEGFKVITDIYMYQNISEVIASAINGFINGVSLCYIRDEKLEDSYFAFIIKNGDNFFLLTDKPKYKHPNQKYMKRCPGRDMEKRINSAWFPYSVTNIDMSDMYDTGRYGVREKSTELAEKISDADRDTYGIKLGSLTTITQDEAFWLVNMLALIKEKFYDNNYQCAELSYAGGMIHHPSLTENSHELAVYKNMPSLELEEIAYPENLELTYEHESKHLNDRIVEKYKDQVPSYVYNAVADTDKLELEEKSTEHVPALALSRNDFGTAEDFDYRQKWIARFNMAKAIAELETDEYKETRIDVKDELKSLGELHAENIIKKALLDNLQGQRMTHVGFGTEFTDKLIPFSKIELFDKWYNNHQWGSILIGQKICQNKNDFVCDLTGKKAGVAITVTPRNAKDLATMFDIPISELPEQLQNWSKEYVYIGNSILDNIDPFDWVIRDHFNEEDYHFVFFLSKAAYTQLRKELGLSEDKFWQNTKPTCFIGEDSELCPGSRKRDKDDWHKWEMKEKCKRCKWYEKEIEDR